MLYSTLFFSDCVWVVFKVVLYAVTILLQFQAANAEEYIMQLLRSDNEEAKAALARVAAFFYEMNKPEGYCVDLDDSCFNRKFPALSKTADVDSDVRFTQETSFIAENLSSLIYEADLTDVHPSVSHANIEKKNGHSSGLESSYSRRPSYPSSPEFQQRSIQLLKSLLTQSLLVGISDENSFKESIAKFSKLSKISSENVSKESTLNTSPALLTRNFLKDALKKVTLSSLERTTHKSSSKLMAEQLTEKTFSADILKSSISNVSTNQVSKSTSGEIRQTFTSKSLHEQTLSEHFDKVTTNSTSKLSSQQTIQALSSTKLDESTSRLSQKEKTEELSHEFLPESTSNLSTEQVIQVDSDNNLVESTSKVSQKVKAEEVKK